MKVRRGFIGALWGPGGGRLIWGDAAILALLGAAVLALLAPRGAAGGAARAEVEVSGRQALGLDLARDGVHAVAGPLGETLLEVRGGRLRVLSSPCARQACRHGGWIGERGQLLVCVPNEIVARLPGRRPGAPDAVTR